MKTRIFLPVVFLAFLISAPFQVQAQSKRAERKLKKEMKKLEKQMKKVSELKKDAFVFRFDDDDFFYGNQLKELREIGNMNKNMAEKYKVMARKQHDTALKQSVEAREIAKKYQKANLKKIKELQWKSFDQARGVMDEQRHQLRVIREHYPDGIEISEIEIEIPEIEFDFELPDVDIEIPELAEFYTQLSTTYESDNNLSINKTLKNESVKKDHTFTVSDDASYLDLRVKGSVEAGEIKIMLKTPKGEEYQTVELNSSADVNWNQKMKLLGENTDQYKGKWTISVEGNDVKGHFSIYMRSK